jgi:hypothetical protein|tara:strand:+ start:972 stop:1364 length:393 start_codon:yes stop_codon:yes gene_type:complete
MTKLEELEDVKFKVEKEAFKPKALTCSKCNIKMKSTEIEIDLEGGVNIKVFGFECSKCKKRYLGLEEAKKLDKALIVSRIMKNDFKMERSLSFDGDNFTFRVPKEFTHDIHKRKVEVMPLGAKQFCVSIQ